MKIETEYSLEEYKDKFPFPIPKTIYSVNVGWGDEEYWETYQERHICGFVIEQNEKDEDILTPLFNEFDEYHTLKYWDNEEEYYDTLEEAKANFARLYKDYWHEEYKGSKKNV